MHITMIIYTIYDIRYIDIPFAIAWSGQAEVA